MPAPVAFSISVGTLPPGFSGDPQALLNAFGARITITPSEPWSSFINGGAQPDSNVGPWLRNSREWRVWSDTLGAYTYQTTDGAGILPGTLPLSALTGAATPASSLIFNAAGAPATVSGTSGQVLTVGTDGAPVFQSPATGSYFSMRLAAPQPYSSNVGAVQVKFALIGACQNVVPDATNFRIPVPANSVWFFRVSAQIDHINGVTPDWLHLFSIRPYQNDQLTLSSMTSGATPGGISFTGAHASGIYAFGGAGFVDVTIDSSSSVNGPQFQVDNNGTITIFSGFRIF